MKTNLALKWSRLLIFAAVLALIASCSEDDKPRRKIVIDGESTALAHGYYLDYGTSLDNNDESGNEYYLVLTTKNLTVSQFGNYEGSGSYINFEFFSYAMDAIAEGTYTYAIESYFLGDLFDSDASVNYDATLLTEDASFDIVSGTLTISKSGDTYKIKFDLLMENNETEEQVDVTGIYEGKLTEFFGS
jgi:hypothetical protein